MKRFLIVLLAGLLVMSVVPGAASAKKKKKSGPPIVQEVEGSVALPAPFTDDSGCYAGVHRRLSILTMGTANSIVGHEFDVDPKSWGQPFALEATGGEGDVDLDIYFYSQFGTVEQVLTDPLGAGAPYSVSFNTRDTVGEEGVVPADMTKVIVCMMAGGFEATFKYTAGSAAKLP